MGGGLSTEPEEMGFCSLGAKVGLRTSLWQHVEPIEVVLLPLAPRVVVPTALSHGVEGSVGRNGG